MLRVSPILTLWLCRKLGQYSSHEATKHVLSACKAVEGTQRGKTTQPHFNKTGFERAASDTLSAAYQTRSQAAFFTKAPLASNFRWSPSPENSKPLGQAKAPASIKARAK
jgi:hypothetical protein